MTLDHDDVKLIAVSAAWQWALVYPTSNPGRADLIVRSEPIDRRRIAAELRGVADLLMKGQN